MSGPGPTWLSSTTMAPNRTVPFCQVVCVLTITIVQLYRCPNTWYLLSQLHPAADRTPLDVLHPAPQAWIDASPDTAQDGNDGDHAAGQTDSHIIRCSPPLTCGGEPPSSLSRVPATDGAMASRPAATRHQRQE